MLTTENIAQYLTTGEAARRIGLRPVDVTDALYRDRGGLAAACPLLGGRRLIPADRLADLKSLILDRKTKGAARIRRNAAGPGIVEVIYGLDHDVHALPDRGYAYYWPPAEPPPRIGDGVLVPATAISTEPQDATVVAIGSDYTGAMRTIVRVLFKGKRRRSSRQKGPDS